MQRLFSGSNILQRQTEVFEELGSAEDLRGRNHMHQTEEGAHAGGCHLDPRVSVDCFDLFI